MNKIEERNEFKTMVQVGKISCNLLHDLISPITSLGLYLETMNDDGLKEFLEPVLESSTNIKNFIRLIQHAVENPDKKYVVNLHETINHAISLGQHKAMKNNVSILIDNKIKETTQIKCRKIEIYQLIMNLVGNAVDSFAGLSRKNKIVKVKISETKKYIRLAVSDNGSGILKKNLDKIFEKEFTTKETGMGIGLSTVKKIVENSFGGQISVQSQRGVGTEFKVKILKSSCNSNS